MYLFHTFEPVMSDVSYIRKNKLKLLTFEVSRIPRIEIWRDIKCEVKQGDYKTIFRVFLSLWLCGFLELLEGLFGFHRKL